MNTETRSCQSCKQSFTIEPEDFEFYAKIQVPAPTWCPECRKQRRMAWRNVRNLYKRKCNAPGHTEDLISIYSKDKPLVVYDKDYWWSDAWDPMQFGMDYDFSVPFFTQFSKLIERAPLPNISNTGAVNSDYCNTTMGSHNCYLIFSAIENENCTYSEGINNSRDCIDILSSGTCEKCYACVDCHGCYQVKFSKDAHECIDSAYLTDCKNCQNCVGCWNLRNKQYCIFNEQYDKAGYEAKLKELPLHTRAGHENILNELNKHIPEFIFRFAQIKHSENCVGDNIEDSKNCFDAFDIAGLENSKYVWRMLKKGGSDSYDISVAVAPILSYEAVGAGLAYNCKFGVAMGSQDSSEYTFTCLTGSKNLFGCVGLNNKQYCILNKQYTKEAYEEMRAKIIRHMDDMPYVDKLGRVYKYGELFPVEISPFAYNESIATEYFPLTKDNVTSLGYKWHDPEERSYKVTLENNNIPNSITEVTDNITQETIACAHKDAECSQNCTTAFRIIPRELQFYREQNIPLPTLCPSCRHYERLKQRNPMNLWYRKCMKEGCNNEFETTFAPDRPEVVYCESCYQQEVA